MAFLTVGITYHNEGELLTSCIESFFSSAQKPDEVLVFDDASSLRPEAFIPTGLPVRVIRSEENIGPGRGRNRLLNEAKGEWIHFHDADDWVFSDWLEKIKKEAHGETEVVLSELTSYREQEVLSPLVIGLKAFQSKEELLKFAIKNFILVPSGTFKTELVRQIKGFRESLWQSEDWDFYIRLIQASRSFRILDESLAGIRIRNESRSQIQRETLTCVLQAILFLQKEIDVQYRKDLADKASWVGSKLFQLGDKASAREAFALAESLGPAQHAHQKASYRWIAKYYGQESAEWFAWFYRKVIPQRLRALLVNQVS